MSAFPPIKELSSLHSPCNVDHTMISSATDISSNEHLSTCVDNLLNALVTMLQNLCQNVIT